VIWVPTRPISTEYPAEDGDAGDGGIEIEESGQSCGMPVVEDRCYADWGSELAGAF
jgi:hypothetical protein